MLAQPRRLDCYISFFVIVRYLAAVRKLSLSQLCVYCVDWEIEICHTPAIDSKRVFAFSSCFSIYSPSGSWLFLLWMANESRADRRPVDWARFGLSSEQNSASSEVHFANKPSVLDETSYGGQEVRDNELYTEEQVCFHIGFVYFGCCVIIA